MDSMLIVLEPPDGTEENAVLQWDALLQRLRDKATQIEGIEMFAENAWQIPLKDRIAGAGRINSWSQRGSHTL